MRIFRFRFGMTDSIECLTVMDRYGSNHRLTFRERIRTREEDIPAKQD